MYEKEKLLLPEFPRTPHLNLEPKASSNDVIATDEKTALFLARGSFLVEEKIDGSNCGMRLEDGNALIRNRTHILNKAYSGGDGPAKKQFAAIWTWFYDHLDAFKRLEKTLGFTPSVYGEWMVARHTLDYDSLPDWFMGFDIYRPATQSFIGPQKARELLWGSGFQVTPLLATFDGTRAVTAEELIALRDGHSIYRNGPREGIYLRGFDTNYLTDRYKMVAPWFESDPAWPKSALVKNQKIK